MLKVVLFKVQDALQPKLTDDISRCAVCLFNSVAANVVPVQYCSHEQRNCTCAKAKCSSTLPCMKMPTDAQNHMQGFLRRLSGTFRLLGTSAALTLPITPSMSIASALSQLSMCYIAVLLMLAACSTLPGFLDLFALPLNERAKRKESAGCRAMVFQMTKGL